MSAGCGISALTNAVTACSVQAKFLFAPAPFARVACPGLSWRLYAEDYEVHTETVLQVIRDKVTVHPRGRKVVGMWQGIHKMAKHLEADDT